MVDILSVHAAKGMTPICAKLAKLAPRVLSFRIQILVGFNPGLIDEHKRDHCTAFPSVLATFENPLLAYSRIYFNVFFWPGVSCP